MLISPTMGIETKKQEPRLKKHKMMSCWKNYSFQLNKGIIPDIFLRYMEVQIISSSPFQRIQPSPTGSMYAIYGNIYIHIYPLYVSIYTIHGSYGQWKIPFKWMIWGYSHFRKPPLISCYSANDEKSETGTIMLMHWDDSPKPGCSVFLSSLSVDLDMVISIP